MSRRRRLARQKAAAPAPAAAPSPSTVTPVAPIPASTFDQVEQAGAKAAEGHQKVRSAKELWNKVRDAVRRAEVEVPGPKLGALRHRWVSSFIAALIDIPGMDEPTERETVSELIETAVWLYNLGAYAWGRAA